MPIFIEQTLEQMFHVKHFQKFFDKKEEQKKRLLIFFLVCIRQGNLKGGKYIKPGGKVMLNIRGSVWDTSIPIDGIEKSREQQIEEMLPRARAVISKTGDLLSKAGWKWKTLNRNCFLLS